MENSHIIVRQPVRQCLEAKVKFICVSEQNAALGVGSIHYMSKVCKLAAE